MFFRLLIHPVYPQVYFWATKCYSDNVSVQIHCQTTLSHMEEWNWDQNTLTCMHVGMLMYGDTHIHLETAALSCRTVDWIDWVINFFFFYDTWKIISQLWYCRRNINTRCLHPLNTLALFYEMCNKKSKNIISSRTFS